MYCRAFLIHDVFLEMQLNGTPAEQLVFLKAFLGSVSEYGGARPWESQLIYDAMQRSGAQIKVRRIHCTEAVLQSTRHTSEQRCDESQ